ncbi:hypothetical protein [Modicisalibacter xianhensis]|uniref:Uncharacterized protein n=1 Tax=Modicisalibacter xianhensis TaxID=442341 RepID=A0A1I3DVH7_9GAMM|nr:hypothetical protein [Halomonas xianhensis]TDX28074.1 hypothetical protein DFO67_11144 [Halomonas xianhensis]SFH90736.1 hypothetical protein SAMN04487959_11244 [Halomonas xianhensis]
MTGHLPRGRLRARRHIGAGTLVTSPIDRTPAWMLAPRAVRRPFLTDPPNHAS